MSRRQRDEIAELRHAFEMQTRLTSEAVEISRKIKRERDAAREGWQMTRQKLERASNDTLRLRVDLVKARQEREELALMLRGATAQARAAEHELDDLADVYALTLRPVLGDNTAALRTFAKRWLPRSTFHSSRVIARVMAALS